MKLRNLMMTFSITNNYSNLKWTSLVLSALVTILAFLLLLSFSSKSWFTYEITESVNKSTSSNKIATYTRMLQYGSFGLWSTCYNRKENLTETCETWTRQTRPQSFSVITVLSTYALFLANLAIFPSWAITILILYNFNNHYIRHIIVFSWIVLILALSVTAILIGVMIFTGLTKFYSPGKYFSNTKHVAFFVGPGLLFMLFCK